MEESKEDANSHNYKKRPWWEIRETTNEESVTTLKVGETVETRESEKGYGGELMDVKVVSTSGESTNIQHYKSSGLMSIYKCAAHSLGVDDIGFRQIEEHQAVGGEFSPKGEATGGDGVLASVKYQSWLEMEEIPLDDSEEDRNDGESREYANEIENGYPSSIPTSGDNGREDYKTRGLMNVYRSVAVPIEVGCLKLTLEDSAKDSEESAPRSSVRVDWHGSNSSTTAPSAAASPSRVHVESSAGNVNRARASAVIRRRQQRRHRLRKGYMVNCLNTILTILYFAGFSPYRPKTAWKPPKLVASFLKVTYWIIMIMAILQLLFQLKANWVDFRIKKHIGTLPPLGASVVNLAARIYCVKAFLGSKKKLRTLLDTVDRSAARLEEIPRKKKIRNCLIASTLAVSVIMAILTVTFGGVLLQNWSISRSWNFQAMETGLHLLIWNPKSWDDAIQFLADKYAFNAAPATIALGTLGCVLTFVGKLYEYLLVDLWMLLAYQVYVSQLDLRAARYRVRSSQLGSDFSELWDLYMERRAICDNINDIFNPALKVMHAANILRFSDFVLDYLENDTEITRITNFVVLIKLSITYWLCRRAANNNEKLCELIVETSDTKGLIHINGEEINFHLLLKEMEFHPIGLGKGSFLVEEGFLIKMLCVAWSVVLVVVDHPLKER